MAVPIIYNRPSLPSLLTEYGFQESVKQTKVKEKKKPQSKKQKKKSWDEADYDLEAAKQQERDEHYENMVRNLYKLRDYYYSEYSGMLADKVEKQRKEIKERDAILERQREKKKEQERIANHQVKKRMVRHTLETTPMMAHIPKTQLYHIVGLEDKLRKEGKIRTVTDYNKFRKDMQDPDIFHSQVYGSKTSDHLEAEKTEESEAPTSSQGQISEDFSLAPDPDCQAKAEAARSLSRISESRDASRPETRENWAVTQQAHSVYKQQSRRGSTVSAGTKTKSDPIAELEKRFPKLEMPKLHCFTMNLAHKPPDPDEVRQQLQLRTREKQRKKILRTKTKMYQLAMANAATSHRILDQHENFHLMMNGPDLCDVIADHHWMEAYGLSEMPDEIEPSADYVDRLYDHESEAVDEKVEDSSGTSVPSRSKATSRRDSIISQKSLPAIEDNRSLLPLTMNEIEDTSKIMESKAMSTLWTNYLRAGKNSMKTEHN